MDEKSKAENAAEKEAPAVEGEAVSVNAGGGTGLDPKVAAALSWLPLIGWIVAIVMLIIEKDKFVRFHAIESLLTAVALFVISFVVTIVTFGLGGLLMPFVQIVVQLYGAYKAYQGEKWMLPVLGNISEDIAGK